MTPLQTYQARLKQNAVTFDERQQPALHELERVYQSLLTNPLDGDTLESITGVYLWGDVGRGKTFLMDLFYHCLPEKMALRLHFHHFMARLHRELNLAFGQKNPLKGIAKRLASECRVLCFDEFFVSDIGDAMLLGGLVEALFEEGVVLVATSNIAIQDLFQNQLQKERFAPSIALLQAHLNGIHLGGEEDHRLRHKGASTIYFVKQEQDMSALFTQLAQGEINQQPLQVCRRAIAVIESAENIAWFDFYAVCDGPRSSLDYIELAQTYPMIMLTGIPELSSEPYEHIKARGTEDGAIGSGQTGERAVSLGVNDDAVRRFISLVDECYDHQVVLLLNSEVPLDSLYLNGSLLFEFRRTYSRLIEMKSHYYQSLRASRITQVDGLNG
ncbi:cell division protein ZapE [Marinomonas rhizomae]|uniref:Cell division protein ZapE n=1 Tax=Marinomonas rhizomae TaxID=491948 RepID=A0A366JA49_9GAMM|nr:cell division protein ZapE [Marinomonas rhizomae]RBP83164.1 cell division protein ZapE [Marinomonas rhizomae]RNF72537.1 cell division protein ZapE [Marinomonas rhizomae]